VVTGVTVTGLGGGVGTAAFFGSGAFTGCGLAFGFGASSFFALTGVEVSFLAIIGVGLASLTFSETGLDFLAVLFALTSAVLLTLA